MSLSIKNPVAVELTRELARALGTGQVSFLVIALREKLECEHRDGEARREQIRRDVRELQAWIAQQAYRGDGRGSGHPAQLNLGDCRSYVPAVARDEELLFVGGGFALTDVRSGR